MHVTGTVMGQLRCVTALHIRLCWLTVARYGAVSLLVTHGR